MGIWNNDRIEKLEARLTSLENQLHGTLWFQKELMLLVKQFTEQVGVNFSDQVKKQTENFSSDIKRKIDDEY